MKRRLLALVLALMLLAPFAAYAEDAASILPWTGEEIEIDFYQAYTGNDLSTPIQEYVDKVFGNVKINWEITSTEDRATKRFLYLATGDIPDIMICQELEDIQAQYFTDEGLFLNFLDYADIMPNFMENRQLNPAHEWWDAAEGVAYFALPVKYPTICEKYHINTKRLEEYGLEVPTTFEELCNVLETIETANPELVQVTGFTSWGYEYFRMLVGDMIGNQNRAATGIYYDEEAGGYYLYAQTDMYRQTVELLADWVAKGYFHPDDFNMSEQDVTAKIWNQNDWTLQINYGADEEVGDQILAPVKEGVTPIVQVLGDDGFYWALVASADTEHPEVVCAIIDWLVGPDYYEMFRWGIEGITYEKDENGIKSYIGEYAESQKAREDFGIGKFLPDSAIHRENKDHEIFGMTEEGIKNTVECVGWLKNGDATFYFHQQPIFNAEETAEFAAMKQALNTYIDEQEALFIYGERPMSEWDDFLAELPNYGDIDAILEMANNAEQRIYRTAAERNYWLPAGYSIETPAE